MHQIRDDSGFTLIELAIVLAIIGILTGGILGIQGYLKNAQLVNTLNEGKMFINAAKRFEGAYGGALPGDMGNATDYWGDAGGCPTSTGTGTCNGNGNGLITTIPEERFLVFHHLMKAGFISGRYTGVTGPNSTKHAIIGQNIPRLSTDAISLYYDAAGITSGITAFFDGNYGEFLIMMGKAQASGFPNLPWLSPREAGEVDAKLDNGSPSTGWIRALENQTACVTDDQSNDADERYLNTAAPDSCTLVLIPQ